MKNSLMHQYGYMPLVRGAEFREAHQPKLRNSKKINKYRKILKRNREILILFAKLPWPENSEVTSKTT